MFLRLAPLLALSCCDLPAREASAQVRAEGVGYGSARARQAPRNDVRQGGMFSREAVQIWDQIAGSPAGVTFRSPDARSRLDARLVVAESEGEEQAVAINLSGALGQHSIRLAPGVGTEVLWSPRSDALAISTSGGGLNGFYRLIVLRRVGGSVQERDVTALVAAKFGRPVRCDWPEPPNVAAIAWLPDGNLVAAAEIVNHSVCDSYGSFKAYEIDPAAMRIVREFSQSEAKRLFGRHLGWEIAEAPDICERQPEQCTVAYRRRQP